MDDIKPKRPRGNRTPKPQLPLSELRHQLSVSIEEAMRLSGLGRARVTALCGAKDGFEYYIEGCTRRIKTESIAKYIDRKVQAVGGGK